MNSDERLCPDCAEVIKIAAKKCKHCGSEVPQEIIATEIGDGEALKQTEKSEKSEVETEEVGFVGFLVRFLAGFIKTAFVIFILIITLTVLYIYSGLDPFTLFQIIISPFYPFSLMHFVIPVVGFIILFIITAIVLSYFFKKEGEASAEISAVVSILIILLVSNPDKQELLVAFKEKNQATFSSSSPKIFTLKEIDGLYFDNTIVERNYLILSTYKVKATETPYITLLGIGGRFFAIIDNTDASTRINQLSKMLKEGGYWVILMLVGLFTVVAMIS